MEKLLINTAAGTPPDIFMNGAEHVLELVQQNLVAPLDREFASWPDRNDFFTPTFGSSTWQGRHYGVPIYTGPRTWWYRADLFDQAGLDSNRPPSTWAELLDATKKLNRTEGDKVVRQGYDLSRWTGNASPFGKIQDYIVYLWQNGGDLIDSQYGPRFQTPEGLEAFQFMYQLKETVKPPGYQISVPSGSGDALIKGAAAIYLAGGWVVSQVYQYVPDLADSVKAILPVVGHKERVAPVFSDWLAIHAQSPNKDIAWKFIQALTTPKALLDINSALGLLSPRRSTVNEFVRQRPLVRYLYETLNYSRPFPVFPKSQRLIEAWSQHYTRAIEGQAGVQSAFEEAARQWRAILQER